MVPSPALFLIVLSALGAAGLYLILAGPRRSVGWVAQFLLAAGGGMLVALAASRIAGDAERGWFAALALVGLIGGVRMITHRQPVYSALYFAMVVLAATGLLLLMQAGFLAAALLIIYGGAILVIYVFVIMLAAQPGPTPHDRHSREPFWACLGGFVILTVVAARLFSPTPIPAAEAAAQATPDTVRSVGSLLLTNYVIAFQAAGVLLLAALVGAIAVARRKVEAAALEEPD